MQTPGSNFLAEIDAFLARENMTATAFGREAVSDPNFVHDLRKKGREPRTAVLERVRTFMAKSETAQ